MIIGKPGDVGQPLPTQRTGAAAAGRPAVAGPVASGEDKVDGSTAAASVTLSDATRTLLGQPAATEVRAAKVAELKLAIEEGRYRPDAGRIADKLLQGTAELLGRADSDGR